MQTLQNHRMKMNSPKKDLVPIFLQVKTIDIFMKIHTLNLQDKIVVLVEIVKFLTDIGSRKPPFTYMLIWQH
jgi:hypothetical protein